MHRFLTIAALLPALAHAQEPACEPLLEPEFVDRIHASLDAIERADLSGHETVVRDLQARIPCLEFVPNPRNWAELLAGIALVNHATDQPWEPWLATAWWTEPDLTLPTGPSHPLARWTPPPAPAPSDTEVPDGVRIYMDGMLVEREPVIVGIHLLQRRTGDGWTNLLLQDEPLPEAWLREPSLVVRTARGEAYAGLGAGIGVARMSAVDERDFFADKQALSASPTLHLDGKIFLGVPLGFQGRAWVPGLGPLRGGAADLGLAWRADALDILVGASARGVEAIDETRHNAVGLGGHLGAELHLETTRLAVLGGLGAGWSGFEASVIQGLGPIHVAGWAGFTRSTWQHLGGTEAIPASQYTGGISAGLGRRR